MRTLSRYTHNEGSVPAGRVVLASLWREDVGRGLRERAAGLLAKAGPVRWLWVVGDSRDETFHELMRVARGTSQWVTVVEVETGEGERFARLGATANAWLENLRVDDGYFMVHESDIESDNEIVLRFLAHAAAGRCPIAAWPVLGSIFYDTWAYRRDGRRFTNLPPYHDAYRADEPFEVDSFGTVWMCERRDLQGFRYGKGCALDACAHLKRQGRRLWVDPQIAVRQPEELWVPYSA